MIRSASQDSATTASDDATSAAAIAGWAKSDTGRMMPGYRDLSRYDTPGYCLAATSGMQRLLWRNSETDTLPKWTASDTIPTAVSEIGRACLSKMTPQSVDSAELYNLRLVALRIGDTALARRTILTHIAKITTGVEAQGAEVLDAMKNMRDMSRPFSKPFHESLFKLVVDMGPPAPVRMAFRWVMSAALWSFDTTAYDRLSVEMDAFERSIGGKGAWVFMDSMRIVERQRVPQLPMTWRRLGDEFLARLDSGIYRDMWAGNIEGYIRYATLIGKPAPTLSMMFQRYPEGASLTPEIGKVTLVARIPKLGEGHMERYLTMLRRMYERYHDQGLEIVLVGRTQGYAWASPPLEAKEEADLIGWYYRDYLKLPFTVLVEETKFGRLRDGRLTKTPPLFPRIFDDRIGVSAGYLVARDGTVINIGMQMELESDPVLEGLLRRELALPTPRGRE